MSSINKREQNQIKELAEGDPGAWEVLSRMADEDGFLLSQALDFLKKEDLTGTKLHEKVQKEYEDDVEEFCKDLNKKMYQEKEDKFFSKEREEPETFD